MVSMYSLHEGKLILTHYCVAKNQPRLAATKIEDKGAKLEFTFMDATDIPNRDAGHMDRATYEFIGKDRYKTRWTWYQKRQRAVDGRVRSEAKQEASKTLG